MRRALAVLPVWAWLVGFVALPAVLIAVMAVSISADSVPPFRLGLSFEALAAVFSDPYYRDGFLFSLRVAALSAAACLVLGYPMALAIARSAPRHRRLLLLLVILPFWTGFLLRITAWIGILRDEGLLNAVLGALGLPAIRLLHTDAAMLIGMVYGYLPFMILPIEARLSAADRTLEQAAADLGASPARVFLSVTLPLSLPGVWAGLALVFVPVAGEYVIPDLLGGPGSLTIGRVIYEEFFQNNDWPQAAALALVLLLGLALPASLVRRR
ncbi:MAG TPA: ABC transporter permease [Rhodopila sp.]|uniref:ABC transporter permease n=1 Tax=Rhodopila sp. TaxID=2480087 RepID=UPI002BA1164A|nr:ABC transporter permease [Rhodopila sp.]HVY16800.1 ABC transporter permease [Rhodopila sp.]